MRFAPPLILSLFVVCVASIGAWTADSREESVPRVLASLPPTSPQATPMVSAVAPAPVPVDLSGIPSSVELHLKKLISEVHTQKGLPVGESELVIYKQSEQRTALIQDGLKSYYRDLMPASERRDLEGFWRSYYLREQVPVSDTKTKIEPLTAAQARTMGHRAMHAYLNQLLENYAQTVSELSRHPKLSRLRFKTVFEDYEKAFKGMEIWGVDAQGRQAPYRVSSLEKRIARKVFRDAFPEPRDLQRTLKSKLGLTVELTD